MAKELVRESQKVSSGTLTTTMIADLEQLQSQNSGVSSEYWLASHSIYPFSHWMPVL
jgi:hypothetical protein